MLRRTLSWVVVAVSGLGVSSAVRADPVVSAAAPSSPSLWRHLELEFPVFKPLSFSFNANAVPGFEALRLPTFRSESVWFQSGSLSLRSFSRVSPTTELECSFACQPVLERTLGAEGHLELGAAGRSIPATYLYLRGQTTQSMPMLSGTRGPQKFGFLSAGLSGLLDF
jgi:hypothetical protein